MRKHPRSIHATYLLSICLVITFQSCMLLPGLKNADRYYHEEYGFSVQLPNKWEKKEGASGTAIVALSPYDSTADLFQENVNVTVGELPDGVDLQRYFGLNMGEISRLLLNFTQHGTGDTRLGGTKALWINYSYEMGAYKLQTLIYMLEKDRNVYIITCSGEAEQFPKYEKTFQLIAKSFRFEQSEK